MTKKTLHVYLSFATAVCIGGNEVLVCMTGGKKGEFRKYHVNGNNAGMHLLNNVLNSKKYIVESKTDILMPNISLKIRSK